MLRKMLLIAGIVTSLATLGYSALAVTIVAQSDPATVLTFASSDRIPVLPQAIANWRLRSWNGCPDVGRDVGSLGQTLRGYGLDGFDKQRVLTTAGRLIDLGCDVDQRSLTGHTVLQEAILYNEPDVVRFLLTHGADPGVTIEVPPGSSPTLISFSGLDSIRFAETLQAKSHLAENRTEILSLLRAHRRG